MGKLKFTLSNIFILVGLLITCLLLENTAFLTANQNEPLSNSYFYLLLGIGAVSYIALFIIEHVINKIKFDFRLAIILTVLFICGLIGIWAFDVMDTANGEFYLPPLNEKIRWTLSLIMFIVSLYAIFFILIKNIGTYRRIKWVYIAFVIVGIVAIIYSYIFEFKTYVGFFSGNPYGERASSFFWNTNMFAATLYFATLGAIMLNTIKKHIIWYIAIILFFLQTFLSISSLSIISEFIIVIVYLFSEIVFSFKNHPKRSGILTVVYILGISTAIIFVLVIKNFDNGVGLLIRRVYDEIFGNENITNNRTMIWNVLCDYQVKHPLNFIFGNGLGLSSEKIKYIFQTNNGLIRISSAHNGFVQVFFNFGIIGVLVCLLFYFFFIRSFFKVYKFDKRLALFNILIGVSLLGYAIGESIISFNPKAQSIIIGSLFYLPIIIENKHAKYPEVREDIAKLAKESIPPIGQEGLIKTVSTICLFVFCTVFPLIFIKSITNDEKILYPLLGASLSIFVLYLTLPYIVSLWWKDAIKRKCVLRTIINSLIILLLIAGFSVACYFLNGIIPYIYAVALPIFILIIFVIEIIIYSLKNGGSFKMYLVTFEALYKNCICAVSFTLLISILLETLLADVFAFSMLYVLIIIVMNIVIFLVGLFAINLGNNGYLLDYFNLSVLRSINKSVIKNEAKKTYEKSGN